MIARVLGLSLAALSLAAAPQAAEYPLSDVEGEALVVPASSPVAFTGIEEHRGSFSGEFILNGTLIYRCEVDCDLPIDPRNLTAFVIPDRSQAGTLPYWKTRRSEIRIHFDNGEELADAVIRAAERKALLAGKVAEVRKRVSLQVDEFRLGIDCDSASYQARFVALARPARIARAGPPIDEGCS
jgi:hypothetical protein